MNRDRISIVGLQTFGHHGVLAHERTFGQRFVIDATLAVDLALAASSDDLDDTIDYGGLSADIDAIVSGDPVDLIETLAGRIADRCLQDPRVSDVEVTVHKPSAPLPVIAAEVAVTVHRARA